jgi:hypothetical protein
MLTASNHIGNLVFNTKFLAWYSSILFFLMIFHYIEESMVESYLQMPCSWRQVVQECDINSLPQLVFKHLILFSVEFSIIRLKILNVNKVSFFFIENIPMWNDYSHLLKPWTSLNRIRMLLGADCKDLCVWDPTFLLFNFFFSWKPFVLLSTHQTTLKNFK